MSLFDKNNWIFKFVIVRSFKFDKKSEAGHVHSIQGVSKK